jgi:hypothetical protein
MLKDETKKKLIRKKMTKKTKSMRHWYNPTKKKSRKIIKKNS